MKPWLKKQLKEIPIEMASRFDHKDHEGNSRFESDVEYLKEYWKVRE